jgi:hypothetical protein
MSLRAFEPYWDLPSNFCIIVYGVRRSGKNVMLMHMLWEMRERLANYKTYVFSGTGEVNAAQYSQFPPKAIFSDIANLDTELGNILDEQKKAVADVKRSSSGGRGGGGGGGVGGGGVSSDKQEAPTGRFQVDSKRGRMKELKKSGDTKSQFSPYDGDTDTGGDHGIPENQFPHILIVLDDCVNESSVRKSANLGYISTAGRHVYVSLIIMSQMVAGSGSVPPVIRTQADTIVVAALPRSIHERDLLAGQYMAAGNTSKKDAMRLLAQATSTKFRTLFIDTTDSSARNPESYLFTYGPVPFPHRFGSWKLGTEEQWRKDDTDAYDSEDDLLSSKNTAKKNKEKSRTFSKLSIPKTAPKVSKSKRGKASNTYVAGFSAKKSTLPTFFIS